MFVVAMAGGGARRAARPVHLAGHEGQEHQGGLRIGGKMISCSASRAACAVYMCTCAVQWRACKEDKNIKED